jgi:hypothetical protein
VIVTIQSQVCFQLDSSLASPLLIMEASNHDSRLFGAASVIQGHSDSDSDSDAMQLESLRAFSGSAAVMSRELFNGGSEGSIGRIR